jgi:hypothetical protein
VVGRLWSNVLKWITKASENRGKREVIGSPVGLVPRNALLYLNSGSSRAGSHGAIGSSAESIRLTEADKMLESEGEKIMGAGVAPHSKLPSL